MNSGGAHPAYIGRFARGVACGVLVDSPTLGGSSPSSTPAAPAASAPPTPAPVSATEAAVVSRDFGTFREARQAERAGKPLPSTVPAASSAATPGQPAAGTPASSSPDSEPGTSADKRSGHGGNAETRIRELLEENKRLKAANTAPASSTPPAASSAVTPAPDSSSDPRPDPYDLSKYPDGQWDPKFYEDMGRWAARDERRQAEQVAATKARETARTEAIRDRNTKFSERLSAASKEPGFRDAISPDVLALRPTDALQPGEAPSALNALADEIVSSEVGPQLLRHFSEHPEEMRRFAAIRTPQQLLREFVRLESSLTGGRASAAPPAAPPPVSSAPPPPVSLEGRQHTPADPVRAAVVKQDFNAYRDAKQAQLRAAR